MEKSGGEIIFCYYKEWIYWFIIINMVIIDCIYLVLRFIVGLFEEFYGDFVCFGINKKRV